MDNEPDMSYHQNNISEKETSVDHQLSMPNNRTLIEDIMEDNTDNMTIL